MLYLYYTLLLCIPRIFKKKQQQAHNWTTRNSAVIIVQSTTISTINIGKKGCCQTVLSKLRKKLYFSSALAILK